MSLLLRTTARTLLAGLGAPLASCGALVLAAPWLHSDDGTSAAARAAAIDIAARSAVGMGLAACAALIAVLRGARPGASTRDRGELVAIPRALALTWGVLGAVRFAEGASSNAADARGTLALAAAAVMALGAVAMHPALRVALRPALDEAALDDAAPSAGERLGFRTAVAVGVPCGAAALLAMLAIGAQGRQFASVESTRAARTWSAALAVPAVTGEPREGPALAARVLAASGVLSAATDADDDGGLPSRPWAVAVAIAAGVIGAFIGRRVGRDAAEDLTDAAARIDALSAGARAERPRPTGGQTETVPEVAALIEPLDALAASLSAMAADQGRAVSARREAARLRSLVFAGVSHDLRGPLNAVLGFAGILELESDGPLTPGQRESVAALNRGGRELLRLVDDLLDAARIEAGRLTVDARETPLTTLVAEAVRDANARGQVADAPEVPPEVEQLPQLAVLADAQRTPQALGALLAYARFRPGAQPDGHVSLRITEVGEARIGLRIHSPGATPGDEALASVLEPFDLPPQGARARAGLGLAVGVAGRVIALHGGAVRASAAPEGGLLLHVELLRSRRPSAQPDGPLVRPDAGSR